MGSVLTWLMASTKAKDPEQGDSVGAVKDDDSRLLCNAPRKRSNDSLTKESVDCIKKLAKVKYETRVSEDDCSGHEVITINDLPSCLVVKIFQFLTIHELLQKAAPVCKRWYSLSHDPDLWRTVDLTYHSKVNDEALERLCTYSENLTSLIIPNMRYVTHEGIARTLQKCPNIKQLSLSGALDLERQAYIAIGEYCPNLVTAHLSCCFHLEDVALSRMGLYCPMLEEVKLSQCSHITDFGVELLVGRCTRLKRLFIQQCSKVSDSSVEKICATCPDMEELVLMRCSLTGKCVSHISKLKKLRSLQLSSVPMQAAEHVAVENIVRSCSKLNSLSLSLCRSVNDSLVEFIVKNTASLRELELVSCAITDLSLLNIAKYCKQVEKVDVGWCQEITDVGVRELCHACPKLTSLGLMRCDAVTVATSQELAQQFPNIVISTMWLDCFRLFEKAKKAGHNLPIDMKIFDKT